MLFIIKWFLRVLLLVWCILVFIYLTRLYGNETFEAVDKSIQMKSEIHAYRPLSLHKQRGKSSLETIRKGNIEFDYHGFPCFTDYNPSTLARVGRCIRTVNVSLFSESARRSECVQYKNAQNTPICIYNQHVDKAISGQLKKHGEWERDLVNEFTEATVRSDVTDVLDLGCNVGTYTLKAAKLGKHVVAVDANVENLRLLSRSLVLGDLTDKVTIIHNAVSDLYMNVSLTYDWKNIGGRQITPDDGKTTELKSKVETIFLDDIEELFRNKRVAIKMDIEGSELAALRGGRSFLRNTDVRFIQMEMGMFHTKKPSGAEIASMLDAYGFKPFRNCSFIDDLMKVPVKQWPMDVCFKGVSLLDVSI